MNAYLNFRKGIDKQKLTKIKETKYLYIKILESDLIAIEELLFLKFEFLTIEIIQNSKHLGIQEIEKLLFLLKPHRIILTLNENFNTTLLKNFNNLSFENLCIDLYWKDNETLVKTLEQLLTEFNSIKHFSIYPENSFLALEEAFMGYKRYHHNMWSINPSFYFANYDFQTIKEKEYLGIGKGAVSRKRYSFWKENETISLSKEFIDLQDHIDRLNYYFPLSEEELKEYFLINKDEYLEDLKTNKTIEIHQKLISYFRES